MARATGLSLEFGIDLGVEDLPRIMAVPRGGNRAQMAGPLQSGGNPACGRTRRYLGSADAGGRPLRFKE